MQLTTSRLGLAMADHLSQDPTTNQLTSVASDLLSTPAAPHIGSLALDEQQSRHEQLLIDHQALPVTALYSFEDLSHWMADTNATALVHALLASFSVILVSELGDKTFIITAIMAMKNSRSLVFIASASALLLMTILSVGMGVAASVIPELYTHYASIVLFLCFGLKMLKESYDMKQGDSDESEFDEVKRELEQDVGDKKSMVGRAQETTKTMIGPAREALAAGLSDEADVKDLDEERLRESGIENDDVNDGLGKERLTRVWQTLSVAPVVINVFTMIFVAEWGDRSQISTVILAAREDVVGVFIGSLTGHIFCTGLAVIGGRFVAEMISVRTMTLLGGIIFLFFAVFAIITGPGHE